MPRPYISWSIDQLETLFQTEGHDHAVCASLRAELSYRTTKRAQNLCRRIEEAVGNNPIKAHLNEKAGGREPVPSTSYTNDALDLDGLQPIEPEAGLDQAEDEATQWAPPEHEQEDAPDDRQSPSELSRIRPLGTSGLPTPWIRTLDTEFTLDIPSDADLPAVYGSAIGALISEIKRTGSGQKRYPLEKGFRVREHSGEFLYEFPFTNDAELFEDATIEIELSGRRIDASIVSIASGRLVIAAHEDLGPTVTHAVIVVDATALLELLRERVEQAGKGDLAINRVLADVVVGKSELPGNPSAIPYAGSSSKRLNDGQKKAIENSLSKSVAYIWGPPGTGKTQVLAEVVRSAFANDKRVLICSNTNMAVDQVLLKICESLGKAHPAMEAGRIVRIGTIALGKLQSDFSDYVTVDGIVDRKSRTLKVRQASLQEQLLRIDTSTAHARHVLSQFARYDSLERDAETFKNATNDAAKTGRRLKDQKADLDERLRKLDEELKNPRTGLRGWLNRNPEVIRKEISDDQTRLAALSADLGNAAAAYAEAKQQFERATQERDQLARQLGSQNQAAAQKEIDRADSARAPLVNELREIEAKLADLRAAVVKDAMVLGATCTKTYLAAKELGHVDMVIVDEASMVMLPMIWFAAGLAKERVVVCGDFRQLPPIVPTRNQAIFDILGEDVFTAAGVAGSKSNDPRRVSLDTQYRMHSDICELLSSPMYDGFLKTANVAPDGRHPPKPYDQTLTIVDTSDLWPFESVNPYFSRFNLMHALLVRNLAWHFHREGYVREQDDLAVCTPYAAQAKLIRKLLEAESFRALVHVGTVHSFQGDERSTVVLELPEGYGGAKMIGQFLQGVPTDHVGARLMNVAVSRAKKHFTIVANLTYLDRLLPSTALLRGVLYDMQQKGAVLRASDLLALRPIQSDLRGLIGHIPLNVSATTLGLFDGPSFSTAVEADIAGAKDCVVLFSGFITPRRVAQIGDLLRAKIAEGVAIRCVTRPPHMNGTLDPALGEEALDMLEAIGCVVDARARIHEKIVVIDKEIVWHGSLNLLSHNHRTDESMTRVVNGGFAQAVAVNMSKRRVANDRALDWLATSENPKCAACGSRSYYDEGKFGPYFRCERKCGWSVSLKAAERGGAAVKPRSNAKSSTTGPRCPVCKGKTQLRAGRFGTFYGCTRYPECAGKVSLAAKPAKQATTKARG